MKPDLLDHVQGLSISERIALVEAIWHTIASDASLEALPLSEEHRDELDRRLVDLQADQDAGDSWAEVRARLERQ